MCYHSRRGLLLSFVYGILYSTGKRGEKTTLLFRRWEAVGWREAIQTCEAAAGATPLGVKIGGLDGVRIVKESKMGKLQVVLIVQQTCDLV